MGRTSGATAAGTKARLLRAAADVFARRGYDGTRVAQIAQIAGLSNGAMYAYFGSKAELLMGALRTHGQRLLADLISADPSRSITELLLVTGRSLRRRRDNDGNLVIEALVAARRDQDVAELMRDYIHDRIDWLADLVREGQARGELDPALPPRAVAHFCLSLATGTALLTPELNDVDDQQWASLLARVVSGLAPTHPTQTGTSS
ncbi:MAG TPA: TetR/AcrR family transcriptional regulator [Pseudonocardiaceae bacterium]|jgi:AcrR family transcriptional regulator|nr:TetR/AcrR family transcriptional regulator [Pseudonocardiaceae bacterium]